VELSWLDDFLALVDCGNFSRAAEMRHLTQPAFSRRIRALEEWVGAPLFDRSTHRVTLTEAGERFRPAAEEVLRRLLQGREDARASAQAAASALTFAATHALSLTFFPAWLRTLEARASLGAIRLVSDSMSACEQLMLQGHAQFLLCHHHPAAPGRLEPGAFRSVAVGEDVLLPVSAPDGDGEARFSLDGPHAHTLPHPLPHLAYSAESGMGRIVAAARAASGRTARLEAVFTSHLAAVLRAMAQDGRGVAWLPKSLVADDLESGRLMRAGGAEWDVAVEVRLFRPRARLSGAAEAFWALVAG